jgi:glycerol-3-phosphate dehydrogenase
VSELIDSSAEFSAAIHPRLPIRAGQIAWAVRNEMARTLDDVLARRTRSLLLDAAATREAAPAVAALLAAELGRDQAWQRAQVEAFEAIAAVHSPS